MTPQVKLDERELLDHGAQTPDASTLLASASASDAPPEQVDSSAPHKLTYGERQGLAMGWVVIALGLFLLFGGLALWAASVLSAGFGGWLASMAVIGVIVVAAIVAVSYFVIRPGR